MNGVGGDRSLAQMFEPSVCGHAEGRGLPTLTFREAVPGDRADSRERCDSDLSLPPLIWR